MQYQVEKINPMQINKEMMRAHMRKEVSIGLSRRSQIKAYHIPEENIAALFFFGLFWFIIAMTVTGVQIGWVDMPNKDKPSPDKPEPKWK